MHCVEFHDGSVIFILYLFITFINTTFTWKLFLQTTPFVTKGPTGGLTDGGQNDVTSCCLPYMNCDESFMLLSGVLSFAAV